MVTKSDTSEALDVTLEVTLEASGSTIQIDGQVSGKLGIGVRDILSGFDRDTIRVVWRPLAGDQEAVNQIQQAVSDQFNQINPLVEAIPGGLTSVSSSIMPEKVRDIQNIASLQLWVGFFGNHVAGETPVSFSHEFSRIRRVRVPVRSSGEFINELPSIPVTIQAAPTEALQDVASSVLQNRPTVTFDIDPSVFVEEVPLSGFGCGELFPTIDSNLDNVEQTVNPGVRQAQGSLSTLVSVGNDILETMDKEPSLDIGVIQQVGSSPTSDGGGGGGAGDLALADGGQMPIDTISFFNLRDRVSLDTVRSWLSQVKQSPTDFTSGTSPSVLSSRLDRADSLLEDVGLQRCVDTFTSRLSTLRDRTSALTSAEDRASNLKSSILDLLERFDVSVEAFPCSEEFSTIERRVNRFTSDVSTLTQPSPSNVRQLISRGEELVNQIEANVDRPDCVDLFTSRVEQSLTRLRRLSERVVGCEERFPSIDDQVTDFENRVAEADRPTRSMFREANSLVNRINNQVSPECRDEFANRVRGALNVLQEKTEEREVRVQRDIEEEIRGREEIIQDLMERLEQIRG